jgi:hypothetical protein
MVETEIVNRVLMVKHKGRWQNGRTKSKIENNNKNILGSLEA